MLSFAMAAGTMLNSNQRRQQCFATGLIGKVCGLIQVSRAIARTIDCLLLAQRNGKLFDVLRVCLVFNMTLTFTDTSVPVLPTT